jgi:hypothetical protein
MQDTLEIKFADLLLWVCAVVLATSVLLCMASPRACKFTRWLFHEAWSLVVPAMYAVLSTFLTLAYYVACTLQEVLDAAIKAYTHLPFAWYLLAALTVTPMCVDIVRSAMIIYLGAYGLVAWFICVCLPVKKARPLVPPTTTPQKSQFFTGLKITLG